MPSPLANATFYVDPSNAARVHADSIRAANPTRAAVFDKIGNNPVTMWAGDWIPKGAEAAWVNERMNAAAAQNALPMFVAYNIPIRDGGAGPGYSGGGAASWAEYDTWITNFIAGFAGRHAIVVYEPDALGHLDAMTGTARTDRVAGMRRNIAALVNAGLSVYVDCIHDNWLAPATAASLLVEVGAGVARGIALNVSNFRATPGLETFGADVISRSGLPLQMVIDTSRNGNGPDPAGDPFNPPGRALGNKPTGVSTNALVDGYIWCKMPGESDGDDGSYQTANGEVGDASNGTIAPKAGDFWPNYAYGLAVRAPWTDQPAPAPAPAGAKASTISFASWAGDTLFGLVRGAAVTGDTLVIPAATDYPEASTKAAYDLTGSHFGAALLTAPNVGNGSVQTHIQVRLDPDNYVVFGWQNNTVRADRRTAGISTFADGPAYDPATHKYLRFREATGILYCETSPDGTTWTNAIPPVPTPFALTAVHFSLQAGNWNAEPTPGTATWGAVNSYTTAPAPAPAPTTSATTTTNSVTLTGLAPGHQYELRVRAKNSAGISAFTPWTPFTTTTTNTVVDFTAARAGTELSALSFGSCISTYTGDGQNVNIVKGAAADSAAWRDTLGRLGPVAWRIPLAWNGGQPGSSAGGARSYGDAADYITAIKAIGGTPIIAVGGTTGDNDVLAADAAALVHYFNDNGGQNGGPVTHWIIGNEPDNGGADAHGMDAYINGGKGGDGYLKVAAAMRAATTNTLSIAGPSLVTYATYKEADYNAFLDACGAATDVLDFHMYDGANLPNYTTAMTWLRSAIAARPATAGRVRIHLGEYNYHPFYAEPDHGANQFYTSVNTVAGACTIGRVVNQGGRAYQYSDNNGPLGLITPGNGLNGAPDGYRIPTPSYYGVKMWTGGNLFRRPTGAMATCTTTIPDLEVFASTATKNVVAANKSATTPRDVKLALTGAAATGTYEVWQTRPGMNPADPTGPQWADPVKVITGTYTDGRIAFTAPPMTVTTILVGA